MKKYILTLIALISSTSFTSQQKTTVPETYGKTHFIIGANPDQFKKTEQACNPALLVNAPSWLCSTKTGVCQAFFSPHDDVKKILLDLISREQKSIKMTTFIFTDKDIANAVITAQKRGIHIEVIADGGGANDRFSKIPFLQKEGVNVLIYKPQGSDGIFSDIMHHKFIIFEKNINEKPLLWTGSFNFTKSANMRNQENVVVLDDVQVIEQYTKQFELLKKNITTPKVAHHARAPRRSNAVAHMRNKKVTLAKEVRL